MHAKLNAMHARLRKVRANEAGPSHRATRRTRATVSVFAAALWLPACGYQLAGSAPLPAGMTRAYLEAANPSSDFLTSLREALRLRGLVLVEDPQAANAHLIISDDSTGQRVLSVSARNIPREYEIFYTVTFGVETPEGTLIEPASLLATRSYTFNETQVLAKSREERILRRALADDLARQVVRRIEAAADDG